MRRLAYRLSCIMVAWRGSDAMTKHVENASPLLNPAPGWRSDLARKIGFWMGSAEDRATKIPEVTLHRRTAPNAPCPGTYEPSVTVIAQGRKRVDPGR